MTLAVLACGGWARSLDAVEGDLRRGRASTFHRSAGIRSGEGLRGERGTCEFVAHDEHDESAEILQTHRAPRRGVHLGNARRRTGGRGPGVRDGRDAEREAVASEDDDNACAFAGRRATRGRRDRDAQRASVRGGVPDAGRDDDRDRADGWRDGAGVESADAAAQASGACPQCRDAPRD